MEGWKSKTLYVKVKTARPEPSAYDGDQKLTKMVRFG